MWIWKWQEMTDEAAIRLANDLASGLITMDQVRAAGLEEELRDWLDSVQYGCTETMRRDDLDRKNAATVNPLNYEMSKNSSDPCNGCQNLISFYANEKIAEQCCENHTCPIWLKDHPKDKAKRVKTLTVEERRKKASKEEPENPCAGCKYQKYKEAIDVRPYWPFCIIPKRLRFCACYYDCENPSCPNWNRLWWRNNDDGSPLLDQEPIKLKRRIQHAAYALVAWMNDAISTISEEI